MTTHLVIPDLHANPDHNNLRGDWIGQLIKDIKPDVVINLGDAADMSSLSSYDRNSRAFHGRSYSADVHSHLELQDRLWAPILKTKKKMPRAVVLEGNHEHRVERALDLSPELAGTIGFDNFHFDDYYDDVVRYSGNTPGVITIDGVSYAHYFVTGVLGRPNAGMHPAAALNSKQMASCTMGHTHVLDYSISTDVHGRKVMGLVAGCGFDFHADWAGIVNNLYWRGVVIKRNVEGGTYDPEFVSLKRLKDAYGQNG